MSDFYVAQYRYDHQEQPFKTDPLAGLRAALTAARMQKRQIRAARGAL